MEVVTLSRDEYLESVQKLSHFENLKFLKNALDLWDIVRFRIVVNDVIELKNICLHFWGKFTNEIIRCRNYYFQPKHENHLHIYKAIHFQILIDNDKMIEIEFMTRVDSVFSLLEKEEGVSLEVMELALKRKEARDSKNWELADQLRDEIKDMGYEIKDDKSTKEGYRLSKL